MSSSDSDDDWVDSPVQDDFPLDTKRKRFFYDSDDDKQWTEPATIEEKRKLYRCGNRFTTLDQVELYEDYAKKHNMHNFEVSEQKYTPNAEINSKISIWSGDSTAIEVDAIVNAANGSLLGGGGIDGAIHSAAGPFLRKECRTLNGCHTGGTKITKGYKLPAKHVLHTVGPVGERPAELKSCYETCLDLVEQHNIKSVVFCCVSTGIFGYPLKNASHIALDTVRKWMETNDNYKKVDRIIFVVFLEKERIMYQNLVPMYFPLTQEKETQKNISEQVEETSK